MRGLIGTLAAAAMLVFAATAANAQLGAQFLDSIADLTTADIRIIERTSRQEMDDAQVGDVRAWENPDSGATGTISVMREFEEQGLTCRALLHRITTRNRAPRHLTTTQCRQPDGTWVPLREIRESQ
jgi:surface antigen